MQGGRTGRLYPSTLRPLCTGRNDIVAHTVRESVSSMKLKLSIKSNTYIYMYYHFPVAILDSQFLD